MGNLFPSPKSRRVWLQQAGGVLGGLWVAGLGGGASAGASQRVTIALSQPHAMAHLPLLLAHTLGHFEAEGLHVTLLHHPTEDRALQAVLSGDAHMAACAFNHTLLQHVRGGDFLAFLQTLRAPQVVLGASLKTLSHYRSPADLRGRRVGVLASAFPGQMVLGTLLHRGGLKPTDARLVVSEHPDELLARYRAGDVDVLSVNHPLVTLLEQRGEIRVLADTRTVNGTRELLGELVPGAVLCAPAGWVWRNASVCQSLAYAVVRSLKWLQTAGPADLLKALPDAAVGSDRVVYLAAFDKSRDAFSPDGLLPHEAAQAAWAVQRRLDPAVASAQVVLDNTYTNQFAQKAKTRFRL